MTALRPGERLMPGFSRPVKQREPFSAEYLAEVKRIEAKLGDEFIKARNKAMLEKKEKTDEHQNR